MLMDSCMIVFWDICSLYKMKTFLSLGNILSVSLNEFLNNFQQMLGTKIGVEFDIKFNVIWLSVFCINFYDNSNMDSNRF